MEIFDLAALLSAGCLAAKIFSTLIRKHRIESNLTLLSRFVKNRGWQILDLIIVLQKNNILPADLNEKLEDAYHVSRQMDTWHEIAVADQRVTEAIDAAFGALDGKESLVDLPRLDRVVDALDGIDNEVVGLRKWLSEDIERFDRANSSVVSRVMGLPRFKIKLMIPVDRSDSEKVGTTVVLPWAA